MPRKLEDRIPGVHKKRKTKGKASSGRPSSLTPEVQEIVVDALKAGAYHETAAGVVGVHISTLRDWLRRGARELRRLQRNPKAKPLKSERIYAAFSDACRKAMAGSELGDLKTIARASARQWQAAAWRLERKYPDRYGRRDRHEVTGAKGEPLKIVTEVAFVGADENPED